MDVRNRMHATEISVGDGKRSKRTTGGGAGANGAEALLVRRLSYPEPFERELYGFGEVAAHQSCELTTRSAIV